MRWWRRLQEELRESPALERRLAIASLTLVGVSVALTVVVFVTGSNVLYATTVGAYALGVSGLLIRVAVAARRVRRQWSAATQPAVDPSLLRNEPDAIVKRWPRLNRLMFVGLALVCAGVAANIASDGSSPLWVRVVFASGLAALGVFGASFTWATLVATHETIAVRTNFRWRTASWNEVRAVDPTHSGLVFRLRDGRDLVAFVTSKSGLRFRPPRYDNALLEELRSRLR